MPSTSPSRRALLRAGLLGTAVASAGVLGACSGERLRTPWTPEPPVDEEEAARLVPDGDLLLRARARIADYRAELSRTGPEGADQRRRVRQLGELWAVQQERVEQLLTLGGLTLPELDVQILDPGPATEETAAGTDEEAATGADDDDATGAGDDDPTGTEDPDDAGEDGAATTTGPAPDGPAPVVVGEQIRAELPSVLEELTRATATNRAVLTSLAAQHARAAAVLGAPVDWPPLTGPEGPSAVPVLARTRPAVFGLEVVAARSGGEERELYESVLTAVRAITRALTTLAGEAAPLPPLGYDLPEGLDSRSERLGLARALVHDIGPAALSVVDRAGTDAGQVGSVLRIVAEAAGWADELEVDPVPFPGMTLP